jgi:hypothetical protein
MHQLYCHSRARDEKSAWGDGVNLVAEGVTTGLYQAVPTQTGLGVGSDRCKRAHSASCVVAIMWISASWWYNLSTPSAMGRGEVLVGLAAAASVGPPSWLEEGATSLA